MKLNWTKLTNFKHYKLFFPTKEKVERLAKELKGGRLNLPDEYRNPQSIASLLLTYFSNPSHLFYEIGKFGGIIGFVYILENHKCELLMKMWNKNIWKPSIVKEAKKLIKTIMDEFNLIRINAETPCIHVRKMARILGFTEDGIREKDFSWNGEKFDLFLLSLRRN